jgi:two-component system, NarL family, response regulator LiaR
MEEHAMMAFETAQDARMPPQDDEPIRVIVADDDPLARRMIKDALRHAGIVVVAEAHNGRQAIELTLYYQPDVVLMDVVMPELDGISATRRIVKELPQQRIVILTSAEEEDMGLVGLRAGASGFLSKDLDVDVLPRALRGACDGEAVISRRLSMVLVNQLRAAPVGTIGMRPVKSPLTAREWEVVDLLHQGRTTEQIADQLVLSGETIRSHIKNLMRKLGVHSRADAVAAAERLRLTVPDSAG